MKFRLNRKRYKKFLDTKILLVILLIILVPIILLTPSSIGVVTKDTAYILITYAGSIFGGILTLIGVSITIDYQNKNSIENLAIQFKPIIKIDRYKNTIDSISDMHTLFLIIKNIGRGEANKLKIVFSEDCEIENYNGNYRNQYNVDTFPLQEELEIKIKYYKNIKNISIANKKEIIIPFKIFYKDFYSIFTYKLDGQIFIDINNYPFIIKDICGDIENIDIS